MRDNFWGNPRDRAREIKRWRGARGVQVTPACFSSQATPTRGGPDRRKSVRIQKLTFGALCCERPVHSEAYGAYVEQPNDLLA